MNAQLELIPRLINRPGCCFSHTPLADTWQVNLRITSCDEFPFVYCDQCTRTTCYRKREAALASR